MGLKAAKALFLLLLVALPCVAFSQNPYSDAAFRTFISLTVNGSIVKAHVTFLNISYFSQQNASAIGEVYGKVNLSRDLGGLRQVGNYSSQNFTASVDPVNGSLLHFTFEGKNVTDSSGNEICNPVATDANGDAGCDITYFKDSSGQKKSVEEYKSCGYVEVRADEMSLGGASLPSATQAAVVCPKSNAALSAFGPAIAAEVGSKLPFCFPAMLIAGLLLASMYYSGRDPLSLFDITTPKLPKTQTFKVKMGQSPQMLRQVQRRYMMIKKQARRDSVREIARMANVPGASRQQIADAKKRMNKFYDEIEFMMKKGLGKDDELVIRQKWAAIMDDYAKGMDAKRAERSLNFSSGLLEAYLKSHQSWQSMNAARNKTGKGWWAKNVSDKTIKNLTNASIAFEGSKVGKVLGRIPFVKKVVSAPTKVLDVAAQLRGSRNAMKGIRGEFIGQAASMLGRTRAGRPIYNAVRGAHMKGDKETGFGKAYKFWTGRSFKAFEEKHDLSKKRLTDYYKAVDSARQHIIDSHNRMFDELASKLLDAMPLRATAARDIISQMKGASEEEKRSLLKANSLDAIFSKLRSGLERTEEGRKIAREISSLLGEGAGRLRDADVDGLIKRIDAARGLSSGDKADLKALAAQLRDSVAAENRLNEILREARADGSQEKILDRMLKLAGGGDVEQLRKAVREFGEAEEVLRAKLLVYLDQDPRSKSLNYYRIMDKDQLKSDIAEGMSLELMRRKYGSALEGLLDERSRELYKGMIDRSADVRTAQKGSELAAAIKRMLDNVIGLSDADKAMLAALAGTYGSKRRLSDGDIKKVKETLDGLSVEGRVFREFNAREAAMKTWVLGKTGDVSNIDMQLDKYVKMGERLNLAFGKNPLELAIPKAVEEALKKCGWKDSDIAGFMEQHKFKDMDSLEQVFKRKSAGEAEYRELRRQLGRDPEEILRAIMPRVLDFGRDWSARQYAAIEIMHGGSEAGRYMASYANALRDIEGFSKVKTNLAYLGGEKAFYRAELGYSDYRHVDTESLVFTARGWEKLFGFIVSDKWGGTSRGEQVLHMLGDARSDYTSTLARYRVLYNNLVSKESVLYDAKFAAGKTAFDKDKPMDAKAYDAIIERGYRWSDKKNGLELLLSVDRKSTPMLEYELGRFGQKTGKDGKAINNTEIILRPEFNGGRADIRDYAQLVARTMGSYYSTREVGFIILTKMGDKWVYGDPFKLQGVQGDQHRAEMQVTQRKEIMQDLLKKEQIKVISVKDFSTYAKDRNYSDVFGQTGRLDRFREGLRASTLYKPSMLFGEFAYGAYNDRMDRMQQWYAGQWQLRQALDRLQHTMQDRQVEVGGRAVDGIVGGSSRFKQSDEYVQERYGARGEEVRDAVGSEMRRLARGESDSAWDNAKAWYHEWHGRIASNIVGEVWKAENDFHNAKLEVRALERLAEQNRENTEYARLYREALAHKDGMLRDYKQAKEEYMGFNRDVIGWTGSSGVYTPQRTMWNLGLAGRFLDSRYVQGTKDAFYQITESSVMRDPRVAIGATNPGWEYSFYVGYNTGQNVYERARFWATNSLWEQQIRLHTDFAYTVHKWWNDRVSFFSRYTSGYPAPVKSDMMYAPSYQDRSWGSYLKTLLVTVPFQPRTYSDYFRARWQDAITFTGAGAAAAAYQSLGGQGFGEGNRNGFRKFLDSRGLESGHYFDTPFRISSQQRYVDQVKAFDDFVNREGDRLRVGVNDGNGRALTLNEARDRLVHAAEEMNYKEEAEYKKAISDALGKYVKLDDRRGRFIRDVFSGSDIQEDGSRNRFLDLYSVFHSNVFQPTIPGMLSASPIGKGEWYTFPQVARILDNAAPENKLGPTKHYWEAGYDSAEGRITFSDRFSLRQDAVAEAYRNDTPVLMHLMKMQNKDINYAPLNTPSLSYASPLVLGIGRKLYRTLVTETPGLESLSSTVEPMHLYNWVPGHGYWERHMERKRQKEEAARSGLAAEQEDKYGYRRTIYQGWAERLVNEGQMSEDFLKAERSVTQKIMDWVVHPRYVASPGSRKISRQAQEDYIATLMKRKR